MLVNSPLGQLRGTGDTCIKRLSYPSTGEQRLPSQHPTSALRLCEKSITFTIATTYSTLTAVIQAQFSCFQVVVNITHAENPKRPIGCPFSQDVVEWSTNYQFVSIERVLLAPASTKRQHRRYWQTSETLRASGRRIRSTSST